MIDYHIHPDYSIDAEPFTMKEYCERALQIGLKEICFTTHTEFDPVRKELDWFVRYGGTVVPMHPVTWLDRYFNDVADCAKTYASLGLKVKAGLEAGFDHGLEKTIEKVLHAYPFDFVIGSVHCLEHVAISSSRESGAYYMGKTPADVGADYFATLREAVSSGLFDVIGHLDVYRRHGQEYFASGIEAIHEKYIEDIFSLLVKTETGLELNTSSARMGKGLFYPAPEILKAATKSGVTIFTVGSDSHRISELGSGIKEAFQVAGELGINLSTFTARQREDFCQQL